MKKIEFTMVEVGGKQVSTKDILCDVLEFRGKDGITMKEMRKRMRLIGKLEDAANGYVELDDSEVEKLHQLIEVQPWNVVDRALVDLADYIDALHGS